MAEDARRLLDHLGIARADVMGYSMGARIAVFLALAHPERVRSADLWRASASIWCAAWRAPADRRGARGAAHRRRDQRYRAHFRAFAEQTGSDLKALAACMRGPRETISPADLPTSPFPRSLPPAAMT